jgi:DNA-binding NtrC family response regulator
VSPDAQVLIIDDEPTWVEVLSRDLTQKTGAVVQVAYDAAHGMRLIEDGFDGVVLLDMRLPDADGLDLVEPLLARNPDLRIVMMTAYGTRADELQALSRGVFFFVSKDDSPQRIVGAVQKAFEARETLHRERALEEQVRRLRNIVERKVPFEGILTRSPLMQQLFEMLSQIVDSRVTVLLQGESGTGKELVARALHFEGARKKGPFIAVNCGGIPETLLESELFGHERGAFTGAVAMKKGKFELADGGTLFLDEIGEMPLHLQVKLLRVLQERQVERIGGSAPRAIDVRIISATHRDLSEMVREKRFREDLYYRLAVFPVALPPLRAREGDIELLAKHFLEKALREEHKPPKALAASTLVALEHYPFPGNVRELENIINRAVLVSTGDAIEPRDLPAHVLEPMRDLPAHTPELARDNAPARRTESPHLAPARAPRAAREIGELFASLEAMPRADDVEQALVERAVTLAQGNINEAARVLGMSRATIYRRLRRDRTAP